MHLCSTYPPLNAHNRWPLLSHAASLVREAAAKLDHMGPVRQLTAQNKHPSCSHTDTLRCNAVQVEKQGDKNMRIMLSPLE